MTTRTIHLTPPQLFSNNIKEEVVCIRAHRERIFRVEQENIGSKFIFHNYGQGGAGWTFLFGCVNESLRQFEHWLQENPRLKNAEVCVIGAGCYGLLTAILLTQRGYTVRIVAENSHDISSIKAAGFFFPRPRKSSTAAESAIFFARGVESYKTYIAIANGSHPFLTLGAKIVPAYYGLDINPEFEPYIAEGLIQPPEKVTIDFDADKKYDVMTYNIIFINSVELIKQLHEMITTLQIPIVQKKIEHFEEIPESIIFNCAGLGAKKLAADACIIPVQGHLITLQNQPDITQLQYMLNVKVVQQTSKGTLRDELIYFAPKNEGILGITFLRGQDSLTANSHEFERLLERCKNFFST
jgi:hypothetical protein